MENKETEFFIIGEILRHTINSHHFQVKQALQLQSNTNQYANTSCITKTKIKMGD